jgi:hypothetical protein
MSQPGSQSVLLIGTATQGPILTPVCISNPQQVANVFGSGPLVEAFTDAYSVASQSFYLVRMDVDSPSNEDYIAALDNLLGYLLDLPFINIYPVGLPIDNVSVIPLLATYSYNRLQRGMDSLLILGFAPNTISSWDTYLLGWMAGIQSQDAFVVNETDVSSCFSLVGSQFVRSDGTLKSAASIFAGLISNNAPDVSLTNQTTGLTQLANSFTQTQCQALADAGIVAFCQTVRHGIAVYDAVTCASTTSSYHDLYCYRIAIEVSERLNSIDRQYLGLAVGTPVNGVAMNSAVQSVLQQAITDNLITSFSFSFQIVPTLNQVMVTAVIRVAGITYNIGVNTIVFVT